MIFPSSFAHETQLVVRPLVVYMNFVGLFDFGTGGILAVAVVDTADMVLLLLPLQVLETKFLKNRFFFFLLVELVAGSY